MDWRNSPELSVMTDETKGESPKTESKPTEPVKAKDGVDDQQTPMYREDVDKIVNAAVQSATDRVRGELYTKLRQKDLEIEDLKKSKMTESEVRKYKEEQLALREKELAQKELALAAVDILRENNLDVEFKDYVLAESPDAIRERALKLKDKFQKAVETSVSEKFKAAGYDPNKAPTSSSPGTFTREQIKAMSPEERIQRLPELQAAMKSGRIKK
jgi:hypothetical protein